MGRKYTKKIKLTNVSFAFNTFKLKPICDEFIDYFEVDYTPAGSLGGRVWGVFFCNNIHIFYEFMGLWCHEFIDYFGVDYTPAGSSGGRVWEGFFVYFINCFLMGLWD